MSDNETIGTAFANTQAAYADLAPEIKARLRTATAGGPSLSTPFS